MGHPNGTFGWADVAVPDMDQGKVFYSGLFGWDAVDSPGGESMPYTMFMLDGKTVAGMGPLRPEGIEAGQPPVWSSYLLVDDVDATAAKAKELGAVLPWDSTFGRMAVLSDPQGPTFGIVTMPENK